MAGPAKTSTLLLTFDGVKMGATVRVNGHTVGVLRDQFLRYGNLDTRLLLPRGGKFHLNGETSFSMGVRELKNRGGKGGGGGGGTGVVGRCGNRMDEEGYADHVVSRSFFFSLSFFLLFSPITDFDNHHHHFWVHFSRPPFPALYHTHAPCDMLR